MRQKLPTPIRIFRKARNTPRGDPTAKNVSTWQWHCTFHYFLIKEFYSTLIYFFLML